MTRSALQNVLFVNPPSHRPVMRRYVASYFAPNFLLPPTDLLYTASAARTWAGAKTYVLDAIAQKMRPDQTLDRIAGLKPDWVYFQAGFATLPEDLAFIDNVKQRLPRSRTAIMGYLPTQFPEKILEASSVDVVIRGEPERLFADLLLHSDDAAKWQELPGLAYREGTKIRLTAPPKRLEDLDALPFPDHGAVNPDRYREPFLGRRIAAMFTARGCPYDCSFCVRTFGRKLVMRSAESVTREIEQIVHSHRIPNIRFMDDTLNAIPARLEAICDGIARVGSPLRWTALARADRLSEPLAARMVEAGCRRLYVGIESGSAHLLEEMRKGLLLDDIRRCGISCRKAGLEVSGFFMVGWPGETNEDLDVSVNFARELGLDYVIVTRLQYWPGTDLANTARDSLERNSFYDLVPRNREFHRQALLRERMFYRRFYLRPGYIARQALRFLRNPRDLAIGAASLIRYLLSRRTDDFI